jgi:hypothetical protein
MDLELYSSDSIQKWIDEWATPNCPHVGKLKVGDIYKAGGFDCEVGPVFPTNGA